MKKVPERQFQEPAPRCGLLCCLGVSGVIHTDDVLLAYFDEIGETGAFVARDHPRFNTSPAFGYAGFVIPESAARGFAAEFAHKKQQLFREEIAAAPHPGRWERKGADLFRLSNFERHPQQFRVFNALVRRVKERGGSLFYYADESRSVRPSRPGSTPRTGRPVRCRRR